jgi:hypothetical protein
MSCDISKFVITKGLDNNFIFTIKADGSTLPMTIEVSDTFQAHLVDLSNDTTVLTKNLTVVDATNGKTSLVVTAAETATLTGDKGGKVDRYYLKPVYKLLIECSTVNNGDFIAKVPEVYVD